MQKEGNRRQTENDRLRDPHHFETRSKVFREGWEKLGNGKGSVKRKRVEKRDEEEEGIKVFLPLHVYYLKKKEQLVGEEEKGRRVKGKT